jgi:hypothetical protein
MRPSHSPDGTLEPYSTCVVVAPADDNRPMYVHTPDARLVSFQRAEKMSRVDVPDPKCGISRSRHSDRAMIQDADAANRRPVAFKGI